MNKTAENILSEVSHVWKFLGRDEYGRLLLFTHVPIIRHGDIRVARGNSVDFSMVDTGAFDFIKAGTYILISEQTYKTFQKHVYK